MEPEADRSGAFASSGRLIVRLGRFSASYEVDRPEVLIGRPDPESEIFPEVAIEWDDAISRRHARILHREDGDYVEDTGSTNGTKLNGVPLSPHDPQRLHSGDLIHVGSKTEIIYYE
jgi:pSer/pThr/pTyr-binding forkhead associated (FHA) protein